MGERKSVYLKWQGNRSRFVDDDSGIDWKDYVEIKENNQKEGDVLMIDKQQLTEILEAENNVKGLPLNSNLRSKAKKRR